MNSYTDRLLFGSGREVPWAITVQNCDASPPAKISVQLSSEFQPEHVAAMREHFDAVLRQVYPPAQRVRRWHD